MSDPQPRCHARRYDADAAPVDGTELRELRNELRRLERAAVRAR